MPSVKGAHSHQANAKKIKEQLKEIKENFALTVAFAWCEWVVSPIYMKHGHRRCNNSVVMQVILSS